MSEYRVFSGPYFPVFSPNTAKYGTEKSPYSDTFYAVFVSIHQSGIYHLLTDKYIGNVILKPFCHWNIDLSLISSALSLLLLQLPSLRKKCPYSDFIWSPFSRIWTKYGDLQSKYPYSVRMQEMQTRKTPSTDKIYPVRVVLLHRHFHLHLMFVSPMTSIPYLFLTRQVILLSMKTRPQDKF